MDNGIPTNGQNQTGSPQVGVQGPPPPTNIGVASRRPLSRGPAPTVAPEWQAAADSIHTTLGSWGRSAGNFLNESPLNLRKSVPSAFGGSPQATATAQTAHLDNDHLPDWAKTHVAAGGGNPNDFVVHNGQMMKAMTPEQLHASTAPASTIGVQGPAPAQGRPGIRPVGASSALTGQPQATGLLPPPANVPTIMPNRSGSPSQTAMAPTPATSANTAAPTSADPFEAAMRANLRDAQSSFRGGDAQAWADHRNHIAGLANNYQQYKLGGAQALAADPNSAIGTLRTINADPSLRATYLAGRGADSATIASLPRAHGPGQTPFNATNYETEGAANPETSHAAALLQSNAPIHEKAAAFASIPGVENPSSPHRQLWDAFMANRNAKWQDFANELAPYSPGGANAYDLSAPVGVAAQIFDHARRGIFGEDPAIATRNRQFHENMDRLGYAPAPSRR